MSTPPPESPGPRRDLARHAVALMTGQGRAVEFPVRGTSMLPNLFEGDRLVCEEPVGLRLGDLLVFPWPGGRGAEEEGGLSAGETTVHRLVGVLRDPLEGDRLLTRGDGNGWFDPPVPPHVLIGRVRAVREGSSGRTYSVRTPAARAYALAVALHDRAWGELRAWAADVDADLGRPPGRGLARTLGVLDRRLLRLARRLLHPRVHPSVDGPPGC